MFSGATSYAESVDFAMFVIVAISVFFLLGIVAAMIFFVFRYSRKRNPKATQIEGNMFLEALWIFVPLVLVMGMFWLGWKDFGKMRAQADAANVIQVKGMMWRWEFTYKNGKVSDTLYLPAGVVSRFDLRSADVNHAFWIPAFRLKEDVIANKTTYMIVNPKELGVYDIECAEYCGLKHSYMVAKVVVVPESQFNDWLKMTPAAKDSLKALAPEVKAATAQTDEFIKKLNEPKNSELLAKSGCLACHSLNNTPKIGPSFAKLSSGKTNIIRDGKTIEINIDANYIKASVDKPDNDIVVGYQKYMMPALKTRLSEADMNAIANLLVKSGE